MSSIKNGQNIGNKGNTRDIVKQGYLKKLKTMKKKYFVLRGDSSDGSSPACLEYYDSEKKWKTNHAPKRTIVLKTCFNINKRTDTKQKCVIALYTKKDCFCIVLDNQEEMEEWLKRLLELHFGETSPEGETIKPTFEHVWKVTVLDKELGGRAGILGPYHLCLTDQTLSLVKIGNDDKFDIIEYSLQKIRRCGYVESFFYMEVGQCTITGAGNLWLQTEDTNIAENMHMTILGACSNCRKNELQPTSRGRSSSANESSKPVLLPQRWHTHTGLTVLKDQYDSLPFRTRTISEHHPHPRTHLVPSHSRPHSMYNKGISYSPPVASSPVSPASVTCSTGSTSSLSMDGDGIDGIWGSETNRLVHSLTPDEQVILEENDDYGRWSGEEEKLNNNIHVDRSPCLPIGLNNASYRKTSPNPNSALSSSPSQGSMMDSPSCGSSPLDNPGAYLLMSPGESRVPLYEKASSASHSRGSSFTEDGYVPMAPRANEDGYIDMDQRSNSRGHKSDRYQIGDTSAGSSCSVTSWTPSTDYPLDKVISFSTDEDVAPMERHTRAYSVGSRPNNNSRLDTCSSNDSERTRAFSVGSGNRRVVRVASMRNPSHFSSSHSSVEPSDDLMELDFSKKGKLKNRKKQPSNERLSIPSANASSISSVVSSYSIPNSDGCYMDMSPRASPSLAPSPPKSSLPGRFSVLLGRSPPKQTIPEGLFPKSSPPVSGYPSPSLSRVLETEPGYMDMSPGGSKNDLLWTSPSSKILKAKTDEAYVEMKPCQPEGKPVVANIAKAKVEHFPIHENLKSKQNQKFASPQIKQALIAAKGDKDDYLDMSFKRKTSINEDNNNSKLNTPRNQVFESKDIDSYVEMSLGKGASNFSKATESEPNYMNMNMKKEKKGSKKDRNRYSSQPITIQSAPKDITSSIFPFTGRKHSTGTPPKIPSYLPLHPSESPNTSPRSSLTRSKSQKNSRRDNKETSTGIITPTGSTGTIFPFSLNSPTNSPAGYESSAKCPVDATSGTVRIYNSTESTLGSSQNKPKEKQIKNESVTEDYVNFQPKRSQDENDYMTMQPLGATEPCRKTSAPIMSSAKIRAMEKLLSGLGSLTVSSPAIVTIPPSQSESDGTTVSSSDDSSRICEEDVDNSKGDSKTVSRTSSVSSVADKELHYASLDLKKSGFDKEESARTLKSQSSLTESSSASTPSPNLLPETSSAFTYAEIDFEKSGSSQKLMD